MSRSVGAVMERWKWLSLLIAGLVFALAMLGVFADVAGQWIAMRQEVARPVDRSPPRVGPPERPRTVPPPDPSLADSPPRGDPAVYFGPDQYPLDAIRAEEQGRVVAVLRLDATGTPRACTVRVSSGSRSLDAGTCAIALRDVVFIPARDHEGRAIASTYVLPVRWVLPDE